MRLKIIYLLSLVASLFLLPVYAVFRLAGSTWWSRIIMSTYGWFCKYYDKYVKFLPGYEEASRRAVESVELPRESIALDVACGTGLLTLKIAGKVREVVGVDISRGQLLQLKRKAVKTPVNVYLVRGGRRDAPLQGRRFQRRILPGSPIGDSIPPNSREGNGQSPQGGGNLVIVAYGKREVISIANSWAFKPENLEASLSGEKLRVKKASWLEPHYVLLVGVKRS